VTARRTSKNELRTGSSELVLVRKDLATTYSRASYTGTTIGKAAFDGRVRDGNGSDHSFMVTKKVFKGQLVFVRGPLSVVGCY
jgi:hypothetical protein